MCFPSYTAEQIQNALNDTKTAFCNSITADKPANLEQCADALKVAVGTLAKLKKKRALNKAQNSTLKEEIEDAYQELTQLQGHSGSDKAQKCLELARKWRYVISQSIGQFNWTSTASSTYTVFFFFCR